MTRKLVVFLVWVIFAISSVHGNEDQSVISDEISSVIEEGRGIGGTGMPSVNENGRGIGGTGMPSIIYSDRGIGGSGIIGTITEFGSIWVNGLEIELNNKTQILLNGQPITEEQLRLGQQVAVLARMNEDIWYADQVIVNHVLTGKVERTTEETLVINGFTLKPDMSMPGQWPTVSIGEQLSVSGYFENGIVYVTDAEVIDNGKNKWQVTGPVKHNGSDNWSVAGKITIPENEEAKLNLKPGDSVTVNKKASSTTFTKNNLPFQNQTEQYLIEYRSSEGESDVRWSNEDQFGDVDKVEADNKFHRDLQQHTEPSSNPSLNQSMSAFDTNSKKNFSTSHSSESRTSNRSKSESSNSTSTSRGSSNSSRSESSSSSRGGGSSSSRGGGSNSSRGGSKERR